MNVDTITEIHKPLAISVIRQNRKRAGLSGVLDSIDFTSLGSKALDVLGSKVAKAPSMYVSPDDPRYRPVSVPQNVYMVQPAPVANTPVILPMNKPASGVGFNIDQKTLVLAVGALLIFMVASKR